VGSLGRECPQGGVEGEFHLKKGKLERKEERSSSNERGDKEKSHIKKHGRETRASRQGGAKLGKYAHIPPGLKK